MPLGPKAVRWQGVVIALAESRIVAKYADDERLFPSEVTLTRKSK